MRKDETFPFIRLVSDDGEAVPRYQRTQIEVMDEAGSGTKEMEVKEE